MSGSHRKTDFNSTKGIATKEAIPGWTERLLDKVSFPLLNILIPFFVIAFTPKLLRIKNKWQRQNLKNYLSLLFCPPTDKSLFPTRRASKKKKKNKEREPLHSCKIVKCKRKQLEHIEFNSDMHKLVRCTSQNSGTKWYLKLLLQAQSPLLLVELDWCPECQFQLAVPCPGGFLSPAIHLWSLPTYP